MRIPKQPDPARQRERALDDLHNRRLVVFYELPRLRIRLKAAKQEAQKLEGQIATNEAALADFDRRIQQLRETT